MFHLINSYAYFKNNMVNMKNLSVTYSNKISTYYLIFEFN